MVRAVGLDYIMVSASSSRRRGTVHRTIPFRSVRVLHDTKKADTRFGYLLFWCTTAIQIRTGIVLYGIFHINQGDGSGAVLVVEGENQLVIIQVDGVHKGIDQHFAVGLLAYVQLAVFSSQIVVSSLDSTI